MELHPEHCVPEEHAIEKWKHFAPPLKNTNVSNQLQNVSTDFESELTHNIKKSSKKQDIMINVLNNKNRIFSYGLKDTINDIVTDKTLLLKTKYMYILI